MSPTGAFVRCLDFFYDASGNPFAMRKYKDASLDDYDTFHYVLNAQGDVVQINYQGGTVYAKYTYDAWGNVLTATGSLASINPLRYRGYYYDTETGWYYLQSRYYDPAVGRFINADRYASTGQGFIGYNMFAYCGNNPVNCADETGCSFFDGLMNAVSDVWNSTVNAVSQAWESAIALASEAMNAMFEFANNVLNSNDRKADLSIINDAIDITKQAALDTFKQMPNLIEGDIARIERTRQFYNDRFSTPEKASNTLSAIGWTLDAAAAYCGGVAAGLSIPTLGMSIPTAGMAAAILAIASLPFHGAALVIDIYNEE